MAQLPDNDPSAPEAPDAPDAPDAPKTPGTEGDKGYNYDLTPEQQAEIDKMIDEANDDGLTGEEVSKIAEKRREFQAENNDGKPPPSVEGSPGSAGGQVAPPRPTPA